MVEGLAATGLHKTKKPNLNSPECPRGCVVIDHLDYGRRYFACPTITVVMETSMPYWSNRRTFLKQLGAVGIAALPAKHLRALAGTTAAKEPSLAAFSGVKN